MYLDVTRSAGCRSQLQLAVTVTHPGAAPGRGAKSVVYALRVCRCDAERRLRHDADNCRSQLQSKLEFDADVHSQRVGDLEQRLATQQAVVEQLNERLTASRTSGNHEPTSNVINRVREQMAAEFDKYRYA